MKHKYDIQNILENVIGYRGLPFPSTSLLGNGTQLLGSKQTLKSAAPLREKDHLGRWYFMPVYLSMAGKRVEFPYAVMSIKGSKTIVETPLVGNKKGSVTELISHKGHTISLAGMVLSQDSSYPEDQLIELRELIMFNQPLEIVSALTGILLDPKERVIITSYDFPSMPGVENGQAVKLELKTDTPFELVIE